MEFIDPVVAEEVPTNEIKSNDNKSEGKTEQAVHQLEDEIDKAYGLVEQKLSSFWLSASKNAGELQDKYHLEDRKNDILKQLNAARENIDDKAKVSEHLAQFETQFKSLSDQAKELNLELIDLKKLSGQASVYMESLDSKLEIVENKAGEYAGKFASFLTGLVSVTNDDSKTEQTYKKKSSPFPLEYGSSRYETDLYKLHTSPDQFLDAEEGDGKLIDGKTEEIAQLLAKYEKLTNLMNELVPVKISYNSFWTRYFNLQDELKQQDENRKKLLDKEDEEDFTWSDDEDEAVDVASEVS